MEIVALSDLHLHAWKAFGGTSGTLNSRFQRTLSVLGATLQMAETKDGILLFAGDWVHRIGRVDTFVLNLLLEVLEGYSDVAVVSIAGNHDGRGRGRRKVDPHETVPQILSHALPHFHYPGPSGIVNLGGLKIYGQDAQPGGIDSDLFEPADIGLLHGVVNPTQLPSGHTLSGDVDRRILLDAFRTTIVGDIHFSSDFWPDDGGLILIPGAPEQHNFGDEGQERGFWVVDLNDVDSSPQGVTFHPSNSPTFQTAHALLDIPRDSEDYHRIRVVAAGEKIPDNVQVIAPAPTIVESRGILPGRSSPQKAVATWMELKQDAFSEDAWDFVAEVGMDLVADVDFPSLSEFELVSVECENFFSYEEFHLPVEDGVNLVLGDSRDFDSNGAGKSTLFEAVYWALFGTTTKGVTASDVIRWGSEGAATVTLEFRAPHQTASITRTRKPNATTIYAEVDGEEIVGASATEISDTFCESVLGVTPKIFQALAYYSQERITLFSRATDAERKNMLADLAGLSGYQEAATAAGERIRDVEEIERQLTAQAVAERSTLQEVKEDIKGTKTAVREFEADRKERMVRALRILEEVRAEQEPWAVDRIKPLRKKAQKAFKAIQKAQEAETAGKIEERQRESLRRIEQEINAATVVQAGAEGLKEDLSALGLALGETERVLLEMQEQDRELELKRTAVGSRLYDLEGGLEKLEKLEAGDCPTCGQEISGEMLEEHREDLRSQVEKLRKKLKGVDTKRTQVATKIKKLRKDQAVTQDKQAATRVRLERVEKATEEIAFLEAEREEVQTAAVEEVEEEVRRLLARVSEREDARIRRVQTFIRQVQKELEADEANALRESEELKDEDNPHASRLEILKDRLQVKKALLVEISEKSLLNAEEIRACDFWRHGFSKQGIQSLVLDEIAGAFNDHRHRIFPALTRGLIDVQFSTLSQTQIGEVREKTEFIVHYGGTRIPYESLSGGQRRRVDLGVMLTLALTISHLNGIHGIFGLMVFDEVFDFLDSDGAEALYDCLESLVASEDIPSVYVVTQDSDMQSLFDQVLLVRQDEEGISHLEHVA